VVSLQRLLRPEPARLQVELRNVPATEVAVVADTVDLDDVLDWYSGAMAELDAVVTAPVGSAGGLYYNELFTEGRGNVLVYRRVSEPPRAVGRVRPGTLPAAELAVTTHVGDHDTIDVTYGELGAWVAEHALVVAGPVRETYVTGPRDTPDPSAWRTEIGWPVFRLSAG
jgi:effector-binding domain-containing protein